MADSSEFPYTLTLRIPFPTFRLASAALQTLSVDPELSNLVRRDFALESSTPTTTTATQPDTQARTILCTRYTATTNRMLRVAVNGFLDSLREVVEIMEELDSDVLHAKGWGDLEGVQGVEQGLTGSTVPVA